MGLIIGANNWGFAPFIGRLQVTDDEKKSARNARRRERRKELKDEKIRKAARQAEYQRRYRLRNAEKIKESERTRSLTAERKAYQKVKRAEYAKKNKG